MPRVAAGFGLIDTSRYKAVSFVASYETLLQHLKPLQPDFKASVTLPVCADAWLQRRFAHGVD